MPFLALTSRAFFVLLNWRGARAVLLYPVIAPLISGPDFLPCQPKTPTSKPRAKNRDAACQWPARTTPSAGSPSRGRVDHDTFADGLPIGG